MADVQVTPSTQGNDIFDLRRILVWTSPLIGYNIFNSGAGRIAYRKTTDGGATWGADVNISTEDAAGNLNGMGAWYDRWTPGNTGTLVHVTWQQSNIAPTGWKYRALDTADDSLGTLAIIVSGGVAGGYGTMEVVRARDGTLYAGGFLGLETTGSFRKSTDNGATWSAAQATLGDANNNTSSRFYLLPGNEADQADVYCVMHLNVTNTLVLKVYDASANSWSNVTISTGIALNLSDGLAAAVRIADSHIIVVASDAGWNTVHNIKCWDITDQATITAQTNVISNTQFITGMGLTVSQPDSAIYVPYNRGATGAADASVYYRKSTDGGATWGGEQAYSESNASPHTFRSPRSPECITNADGGRFMAVWFVSTLNDLYTSFVNSVAINAVVVGSQGGPGPKIRSLLM